MIQTTRSSRLWLSPCLQDGKRPNNEKILCLVERDSEDEDLEDEDDSDGGEGVTSLIVEPDSEDEDLEYDDSDDEKNNMMSFGA